MDLRVVLIKFTYSLFFVFLAANVQFKSFLELIFFLLAPVMLDFQKTNLDRDLSPLSGKLDCV